MKYIKEILASVVILGFSILAIHGIVSTQNKMQLRDVQLKSSSTQLKSLQLQYEVLDKNLDNQLKQKDVNQEKVQQLQDEKSKLEQEKQSLEVQLQAKLNAKSKTSQVASSLLSAGQGTAGAVEGCGDNEMARYIYMHESGCNPSATNAGGCRGIGQACPGSKLPCGADYVCQNAYFTNYANQRYGGWAGAYEFWLSHHWW